MKVHHNKKQFRCQNRLSFTNMPRWASPLRRLRANNLYISTDFASWPAFAVGAFERRLMLDLRRRLRLSAFKTNNSIRTTTSDFPTKSCCSTKSSLWFRHEQQPLFPWRRRDWIIVMFITMVGGWVRARIIVM